MSWYSKELFMELHEWKKKIPPLLHPIQKKCGYSSITMMVKYDTDPDTATLSQIMLQYAFGYGKPFIINKQLDVITSKVIVNLDGTTAVFACASPVSLVVLSLGLENHNEFYEGLQVKKPFKLTSVMQHTLLELKN